MKRALFLDRDGVINIDHGYVWRIEDFTFTDGIFDLCRTARQLGYMLVVVTNQSGIARGLFSEADYQQLTAWMQERFTAETVPLAAVYHCPFHPQAKLEAYRKDSSWRKPAPGMLLQAAADLDLDLSHSILIGDKEDDITAARAAGLAAAIRLADPAGITGEADETFASLDEIRTWLKRHAN